MKRLINDNNPIILNSLILTILSMLFFLLILAPVVIFSYVNNNQIFAESSNAVYGNNNPSIIESISTLKTILEFFFIGLSIELIRRKRSVKFSWKDNIMKEFAITYVVSEIFYIILIILISIFK